MISMNSLYLIGDTHTVNAFRICGVEGFAGSAETSSSILENLMERGNASVILMTMECAEPLAEMIKKINLESPRSVIVSIPGIDDDRGFGRSLISYITDALGVAL